MRCVTFHFFHPSSHLCIMSMHNPPLFFSLSKGYMSVFHAGRVHCTGWLSAFECCSILCVNVNAWAYVTASSVAFCVYDRQDISPPHALIGMITLLERGAEKMELKNPGHLSLSLLRYFLLHSFTSASVSVYFTLSSIMQAQ